LSDPASISWYEHNASVAAQLYESVSFETVHDWLLNTLPNPPELVLDVGAGTGRAAAWLVAHGYELATATID
jgi:ubiquinone/menaquinone biosynthesis C-methylase UbiE